MKKIITLIFLFQLLTVFAQDDAFTDEVVTNNGLIYFGDKTFTGLLFSSQDNIPNNCDCTLKAKYSNGKINGLKEEWYVSGEKKFKGSYIQAKKNGTHIFWNTKGSKKLEEIYIRDKLIESKKYFSTGNLEFIKKYSSTNFNEKVYTKIMYEDNKTQEESHFKNNYLLDRKKYYSNGNLKSHIKHNPNKLSETIYEKFLFENGVVQKESHFKNNVKDGNYLENFANGKAYKKIKYHKGNQVEKIIYRGNGSIKESLLPTKDPNYLESIQYFENEKIELKGYFSENFKKDSVWTRFDKMGYKLHEQAYLLGRLTREGKYKNNQKDGIWKHYMQDDVTQKNITYQSGKEIKTYTFNVNHLFYNNYKSSDDVALFEFIKKNGDKENIAMTSDTPFTQDSSNKRILGTIAIKLLEQMRMVQGSAINENTTISKKIHITNMNVKYTSTSVLGHLTNEYFTTYDAYIYFNLMMVDVDGKKLFSKSYKFNKSGKLLNSLLNAAVQTYATTKNKALVSALKSIKFKKLLKKHFPKDKKSKR